jgi:chromosome segregation ATPase
MGHAQLEWLKRRLNKCETKRADAESKLEESEGKLADAEAKLEESQRLPLSTCKYVTFPLVYVSS